MTDSSPQDKATALHYDGNKAPVVTAQGHDTTARRIIEEAKERKIPILEHPVLAEALDPVNLGQEIPEELYLIIAEVLSLVYRLEDRSPS